MAQRHAIHSNRPGVLLAAAGVACTLFVGAAGCGWKGAAPSPTRHETLVVMQNQHGDVLGSKTFPGDAATITINTGEIAGTPQMSSRYIVIRQEPLNGRRGRFLARTNTGAVSFQPPADGSPVRAVFMSTADLPERVMDCFYDNSWGANGQVVARVLPGVAISGSGWGDVPDVRVVDGDERLITDAIDDINRALTDRRGTDLGRLVWGPRAPMADIQAGFGEPPAVFGIVFGFGPTTWYVLVNPHDPPGAQTTAFVQAFLCGGGCTPTPCGQSMVSYLLGPESGYRLSPQGVSLVRFGAQANRFFPVD